MNNVSVHQRSERDATTSARRIQLISYALLSVAFFIGFFNRFSPATFAHTISNDFGIDATALGGLAAMHFWIYTLMQIPAGAIIDRFGIRQPVFVGTAITGLGAMTLSLAPAYWVALAGPAFVGFGMSLVFVGVMKNNSVWFDASRFGLVTGITMLIAAVGSISAEAPASYLLMVFNWRTIFFYLALSTLVVAALIYWFYREPSQVSGSHTVGGTVLAANDSKLRIDWRVLGSRQLWLIMLAIAGTNGTFYAFAGLWGGPLLTDGFGVERSHAALLVTASLVPYGLGSLMVGQFSDKLRNRKLFIVGASMLNVVGWGWLATGAWSPDWSGWILYLALGLSSAQVVVSFAAVKESVPASTLGLGLALVNMGVFLTSAIVQLVFGWILDATSGHSGAPSLGDYRVALTLPLAISVIGLIAAVFVRDTFKLTD